ncbi:MAG: 30S ribosomal protein S6 [Parcubacteria group bacterium GW2011_GWA2_53_21]|nr:MAG: 30S ribosomal protein S6 [Parcubacteria group bacterium GW2011_GWA2_53_21]
MHTYELLFILPGTLDDKEVAARSEEVVSLVKEFGSDVELQPIGKNRLAYPIKQIRYGYFFIVVFKAPAPAVKKLEDRLALMRDLLRAMITHFNTGLTATQKIAYSTDSSGVTTMTEKSAEWSEQKAPLVAEAEAVAAAKSPDKELNIEEISKKLDDLISGDFIIPQS